MMAAWQQRLDAFIDEHFDYLVEVRRHLHAHPEPSGEEFATSLYLYQILSDRGYAVEMGPEGRGVKADSPTVGSRVALRADLDALRIHDHKQVAYRSQHDGILHACGHDAHATCVLGALLALRYLSEEGLLPHPVPVRGVFQPAEETAEGARQMVDAGILDGVEAIFATHMDPTRNTGQVGIRTGIMTANCDALRLVIQGRGGHAARPHESNDPIAAAAQLISTLYLFVPRGADSQDAVVISIGQILGGENPNVIPESVELRGTLRTLDRQVRSRTIEHIRQLARGIAEASGTQITVASDVGIGSVVNDAMLADLVRSAAIEVVGRDGIQEIVRPSMGSEDFAAYLDHVPGCMFRLGCASDDIGHHGLHTPLFDIDERALAIGAKILTRAAVAFAEHRSKTANQNETSRR
ncbi:MAG: amidohydrolase [Planctomycetales bacterium]|nr:amidohydrolase [Planctomycetales bacterium]